jgi:hypothetical protein
LFDFGQRGRSALKNAVADINHRLASNAKTIINLYSRNELLVRDSASRGSGGPCGAGAEVATRDCDSNTASKRNERRRNSPDDRITVLKPVAENVGDALPIDDDV